MRLSAIQVTVLFVFKKNFWENSSRNDMIRKENLAVRLLNCYGRKIWIHRFCRN